MDVYVSQLTGTTNHDWFYTNAQVIVRNLSPGIMLLSVRLTIAITQAAYKNYVTAFVSRYVNEPTIFAWELANEPRCTGSTGYASMGALLLCQLAHFMPAPTQLLVRHLHDHDHHELDLRNVRIHQDPRHQPPCCGGRRGLLQ